MKRSAQHDKSVCFSGSWLNVDAKMLCDVITDIIVSCGQNGLIHYFQFAQSDVLERVKVLIITEFVLSILKAVSYCGNLIARGVNARGGDGEFTCEAT